MEIHAERRCPCCREQANFHIFYYFYDAMESSGHLKQYDLDSGRKYRYLRTEPLDSSSCNDFGVREDPTGNVEKFKELEQHLVHLGFQDNHLETLWNLIAAVLNLGEVRFSKKQEERAELENPEAAAKGEELFLKPYMVCVHPVSYHT
jgi:myosin-3